MHKIVNLPPKAFRPSIWVTHGFYRGLRCDAKRNPEAQEVIMDDDVPASGMEANFLMDDATVGDFEIMLLSTHSHPCNYNAEIIVQASSPEIETLFAPQHSSKNGLIN